MCFRTTGKAAVVLWKVSMFADYSKTFSVAVRGRLRAPVHGGPDAGMGAALARVISPAGRCALEAVTSQETGFGRLGPRSELRMQSPAPSG